MGKQGTETKPTITRLGRSTVRCDTKLAPDGGTQTIGESGAPSSKPESAWPQALWLAAANGLGQGADQGLRRLPLGQGTKGPAYKKDPGLLLVFKNAKAQPDGWHKTTSSSKAIPPEQEQAWALELVLRLS